MEQPNAAVESGVSALAKEFSAYEYEMKIDVRVHPGPCREPSVRECLTAIIGDEGGRFHITPDGCTRTGTHYFFGKEERELLVVMERDETLAVKEKGDVRTPKGTHMLSPFVLCRTETQYDAPLETILDRVANVMRLGGSYHGTLRKNVVDARALDTITGRNYIISVGNVQRSDGAQQRQIEIEYTGHTPGNRFFDWENEVQLVDGIATLGAVIMARLNDAVVAEHRIRAVPTTERKYDFVREHQ